MPLIASLLLGLALTVAAYLLMPRPKPPARPEIQDLESPTADAGKPIPVVFGRVRITGLNILWYGDKSKDVYQDNA